MSWCLVRSRSISVASKKEGRRSASSWMQSSARVARLAAGCKGHRARLSRRLSIRPLARSSLGRSSSLRKTSERNKIHHTSYLYHIYIYSR